MLVIEKGTIDAIVCAENGDELVEKMIAESLRVLKPRGFFISISFGNTIKTLEFTIKRET
jgi:ubiquinone/menaquinone biosynthesis C-methylase UbiE